MVQILDPGPSVGGGLGASIGTGIGEGLSAGLQLLMQDRVAKMRQRRQARALEEAGLPGGLAALDPNILREFAKSKAQEQAIQSLFGTSVPAAKSKAALQSEDMSSSLLPSEREAALPPLTEPEEVVEEPRARAASRLKDMSDSELQILQGFPAFKDIAKSELDIRARKLQRGERREEAHIKREFERAKPILKRMDERAETIPAKENALVLMKEAIKDKNLGFFSRDNLAEVTGIEGLRSPEGAVFMSAGKEYFLGSLKRAGARPNQWIEQQIQKMLAKIGRSRAANLSVLAALESELNVEKKGQDLLNEIVDSDEKKFGYIKGNIGQRMRVSLKKFADKEQTRLAKELKEIVGMHSNKKTNRHGTLMIDPQGKLRRVPKEDVKKAQKAGYKLK